jgi:multidrug efflux pump subunit AcrA (membrane-fusion protein)
MRKKIIVILIGLVVVGMAACGRKEETVPEKIRTVRGPKVEAVQTLPVEEVYEVVVEESQIRKIRAGATVRVRIDALGPREWLGRVAEIGPAADPASRTAIVKVDLPQKADRARGRQILRSGLLGKALFPMGQKQTLTIPQKALMLRGQLQEIYVLDPENIARLRLIKTGKQYGQRVEVLAGLRERERIIVEGVEAVSDGSRVE